MIMYKLAIVGCMQLVAISYVTSDIAKSSYMPLSFRSMDSSDYNSGVEYQMFDDRYPRSNEEISTLIDEPSWEETIPIRITGDAVDIPLPMFAEGLDEDLNFENGSQPESMDEIRNFVKINTPPMSNPQTLLTELLKQSTSKMSANTTSSKTTTGTPVTTISKITTISKPTTTMTTTNTFPINTTTRTITTSPTKTTNKYMTTTSTNNITRITTTTLTKTINGTTTTTPTKTINGTTTTTPTKTINGTTTTTPTKTINGTTTTTPTKTINGTTTTTPTKTIYRTTTAIPATTSNLDMVEKELQQNESSEIKLTPKKILEVSGRSLHKEDDVISNNLLHSNLETESSYLQRDNFARYQKKLDDFSPGDDDELQKLDESTQNIIDHEENRIYEGWLSDGTPVQCKKSVVSFLSCTLEMFHVGELPFFYYGLTLMNSNLADKVCPCPMPRLEPDCVNTAHRVARYMEHICHAYLRM